MWQSTLILKALLAFILVRLVIKNDINADAAQNVQIKSFFKCSGKPRVTEKTTNCCAPTTAPQVQITGTTGRALLMATVTNAERLTTIEASTADIIPTTNLSTEEWSSKRNSIHTSTEEHAPTTNDRELDGKYASDLASYPSTSQENANTNTTGVQHFTTVGSTIFTVTNCPCAATCEYPNGCLTTCTQDETFVCPKGYYLKGSACVPPEDCGCYYHGEGVIQENATVLIDNCTAQCTCINGGLSCNEYQCHPKAVCEDRNDGYQCYCSEGYIEDDVNCTYYTDCQDIYDAGFKDDGVYFILPGQYPGLPFQVYCRSGWTVFQRREDGTVNFYRKWLDYKDGFGDVENEMWLGNEKIFYLTNQKAYKLQIYGLNTNGSYYLKYDNFRIGNEETNYRLVALGAFHGTLLTDYMAYHRNMEFTTKDRENDEHSVINCAVRHLGAWWYNQCYKINLNGIYGIQNDTGICLLDTKFSCDNLFVEMRLKPV